MKKIATTLLLASLSTWALTLGEIPKNITLSGENGGKINGDAWHSSMLKKKVYVLFYVDPDKKGDNEAFIDALHKKNYDLEKYGSVAIINLKATWLPSFAIEKKLESKQQELPHTLYIKDKTKYLVQEWALVDDASNVLVFNKDGNVIYQHEGLITEEEMPNIFALIEENLNK